MSTTRKSSPTTDYFIGKTYGFNPQNPYGYFSLMGANHRRQELAAQKKKQETEMAFAAVRARNQKFAVQSQKKETKKSFWQKLFS